MATTHTGAFIDGDEVTIVDELVPISVDTRGRIPLRQSLCPWCQQPTILVRTKRGDIDANSLLLEATGGVHVEFHQCGPPGDLKGDPDDEVIDG